MVLKGTFWTESWHLLGTGHLSQGRKGEGSRFRNCIVWFLILFNFVYQELH